MARKPKKPVKKPGKDRWINVQVVQSANALPVYIQQRMGEAVSYRGVYLCDTKMQVLSFWSNDRGMEVEESADLTLVISSAARANIPLTKATTEAIV